MFVLQRANANALRITSHSLNRTRKIIVLCGKDILHLTATYREVWNLPFVLEPNDRVMEITSLQKILQYVLGLTVGSSCYADYFFTEDLSICSGLIPIPGDSV